MPIGIGNIGWKMYIINGGWDVITFVLIVSFWFVLFCMESGVGHWLKSKANMAGCILGRDQGQEFGGN